MKNVKHYSEDFKRNVVQHYLSSEESMKTTADKFKITNAASINQWLRKFEKETKSPIMHKSSKKPGSSIPDTPEGMISRIKELEYALERERLNPLGSQCGQNSQKESPPKLIAA